MYILQLGIYSNSALLFFCFVHASCHYTLIKSVQPDPSSPTHVHCYIYGFYLQILIQVLYEYIFTESF